MAGMVFVHTNIEAPHLSTKSPNHQQVTCEHYPSPHCVQVSVSASKGVKENSEYAFIYSGHQYTAQQKYEIKLYQFSYMAYALHICHYFLCLIFYM